MDVYKLYDDNIRLRLENERLIAENSYLRREQRESIEKELSRNSQYNLIEELIRSGTLKMEKIENREIQSLYLVEINRPYKFYLHENDDLVIFIKKLKEELKNGS